jgi:hypothetical protein
MPSRIAAGYNFRPVTVKRVDELAKFYEMSRTGLIERLVKEEYERVIQRSQFPPPDEGCSNDNMTVVEEVQVTDSPPSKAYRESSADLYRERLIKAEEERKAQSSVMEEAEFAGSLPDAV